jgi:hypothetical protein
MEADPSYLGAKLGVARMNTALDRYGDAIRMYEAVLQEQLPAETFRAVSEDLAYVQVTAGDVGGAGLTLRAAGLSEEAVASKLAQIIAAAAERFTRRVSF